VGRATRGVTFDTGVLIALERRHAGALALLRACRISRARITIPAGVVAEWWRGTHRALLECGSLEPLSPELAQRAGELLAKTKRSNAIDATVVASAAQRGDLIVTGDSDDLRPLAVSIGNVTVEPLR
jgi:predicted nucleic acid-binding protein